VKGICIDNVKIRIGGMSMEKLVAYCRQHTNLTAMQCEILKRISVCFPFIADLAHAHLSIYVQTRDANRLLVIGHEKPHTTFSPATLSEAGRFIRKQEEPLVEYTMRTGKPIQGKREWDWGLSIDMYTYAIHDGSTVIAVVSFEPNSEELKTDGYQQLLETACVVLVNARKVLDKDMYRPLSASDGIIITDKYNRIVFANTAAVRIYKVLGVGNLIGYHMFDRQLTMHITKETIASHRPYEKELEAGELILVQRNIPIKEGGNLLRRVVIVSDITDIRKKDKEILIKSAVIQEIHHRVKNNLQTIASLLRLQSRRTKSQEVKAALKESVNRILSISVVHEFLSQQDAEFIDVVEVTKNILNLIVQNMLDPAFELETRFTGPAIILPSEQASNLALIVNELILNSLQHGFEEQSKGLIGLDIRKTNTEYLLDLYDNGAGVPENFDQKKSKSLGLQIVRTLIEDDMGGTFKLINKNGTHAKIRIPRTTEGENKNESIEDYYSR
jgi:two-component sensor histidine kinase